MRLPATRLPFICALLAAALWCVVHPSHAHPEKPMPTSAATTGIAFYARANLYSLPIRPELPISEAEAEAARAHYRFFMEGTHIRWAEKWLAERSPVSVDAQWVSKLAPGVHYFLPAAGGLPPQARNLAGIREEIAYFRVEVFPDGRAPKTEKVTRSRTFHHDYEYWNNGKLKRWHFETESSQGDEHFDQTGKALK